MIDPNSDRYHAFRVRRLPVGIFGTTYVVVTTITTGKNERTCEFFVISKLHKPHLYSWSATYSVDDEDLAQDEFSDEFLIDEALLFANDYLVDALYEATVNCTDLELDKYFPDFLPLKHLPLHGLWMRGENRAEISTIRETTKSARLKLALDVATRMKMTIRSA